MARTHIHTTCGGIQDPQSCRSRLQLKGGGGRWGQHVLGEFTAKDAFLAEKHWEVSCCFGGENWHRDTALPCYYEYDYNNTRRSMPEECTVIGVGTLTAHVKKITRPPSNTSSPFST
jgi:hypothetical protein